MQTTKYGLQYKFRKCEVAPPNLWAYLLIHFPIVHAHFILPDLKFFYLKLIWKLQVSKEKPNTRHLHLIRFSLRDTK